MQNKIKRDDWIDTLKACAICLVLVGHMTANARLEEYIYSFHIPLFFWVSGYLFQRENYQSFKYFIIKRAQTLIIPYFIFATFSFFVWLFIVRPLSIRGQALSTDPWYPFLGIFYAVGEGNWKNPLDVALWFLPCIFVVEIIYWRIRAHVSQPYQIFLVILSGIIGYLTTQCMSIRLPWSADVALTAVVFYAIGDWSKEALVRIKSISHWRWAAIVTLLLAVSIIASAFNGKADMNYNHYGNLLLFYAAALSGILTWIMITSIIPGNNIVTYVGKNTIIIVGLSGVANFVLQGIYFLVTKELPGTSKIGIFESLAYSTLLIASLTPAMLILNNYMPYLLGRKKASTGK